MNSFMSWVGGKKSLRDAVLARFPPYYERYIEVFGGAGWVLFHKPPGNDFGMDTKIRPCEDDCFTANVEVQLSPTFWGWLFQFTGQMRITAPESAMLQYGKLLENALKAEQ